MFFQALLFPHALFLHNYRMGDSKAVKTEVTTKPDEPSSVISSVDCQKCNPTAAVYPPKPPSFFAWFDPNVSNPPPSWVMVRTPTNPLVKTSRPCTKRTICDTHHNTLSTYIIYCGEIC